MVTKTRVLLSYAGAILMNGVAGNFNNYGVISPYFASYFYQQDTSIRNSDFIQVPGIASISECLTTLMISYLIKYIRAYYLILMITIFSCLTMFLASFISNPLVFCWVFGLSLGSLSGCILLPSIWILWNHFPEHKGKISGITLAGYSFGAVPFGLMFTYLVNPGGEKAFEVAGTDREKMFGQGVTEFVPFGIRFISICYLICALTGLFLIPREVSPTKVRNTPSTQNTNFNDMIKSFPFWNLFFMILIALAGSFYMLNLYKIVGINFLNDDIFISYVGATFFILAGVGRIFFGYLFDKYNWKIIMCINYIICALLMGTFWFTLNSKFFFGFYVISYNFIGSSMYCSVLLQTDKAFPNDEKVVSYVCLAFMPLYFSGYFFDALITPNLGYFNTFLILSAMNIIATLQVLIQPTATKSKLFNNLLTPA